jgi:hypothetical protein
MHDVPVAEVSRGVLFGRRSRGVLVAFAPAYSRSPDAMNLRFRSPPRLLVSSAVVAFALGSASALHAAQSALKGPYVTALSDSDATVRFELETSAPATVELVSQGNAGPGDAAPARPIRFESHEPSAMHVVHVSGLQPATRYAYAVRAAGALLAEGHFATAPLPAANAPVTFLVYGDDRTDDAAHATVVRAMSSVPADFLVNTGDMVQDGGSAPNWQTFFDIERSLLRERPLFSAVGNHELYDDTAGANFARYFGFTDESGAHPYGTERFGSVRLFFLNGDDRWGGGDERAWLERALARSDGEPGVVWRFAVLHHGPWSAGPHGPNTALDAAGIPELLAAHKIDRVFSGHDHIYERGDAGVLKYIISGGGGAPLYRDVHPTAATRKVEATHHFVQVSVHDSALQIEAWRTDGSMLERCGFAKGGPWDCDAPAGPAVSATAPAGPVVPVPAPAPGRGSACAVSAPGRAGSASGGEGAAAAFARLLAGVGVVWAARRAGKSRDAG